MYPLVWDLSSINIIITNEITIVIGTTNTIMIYFSFQVLYSYYNIYIYTTILYIIIMFQMVVEDNNYTGTVQTMVGELPADYVFAGY